MTNVPHRFWADYAFPADQHGQHTSDWWNCRIGCISRREKCQSLTYSSIFGKICKGSFSNDFRLPNQPAPLCRPMPRLSIVKTKMLHDCTTLFPPPTLLVWSTCDKTLPKSSRLTCTIRERSGQALAAVDAFRTTGCLVGMALRVSINFDWHLFASLPCFTPRCLGLQHINKSCHHSYAHHHPMTSQLCPQQSSRREDVSRRKGVSK